MRYPQPTPETPSAGGSYLRDPVSGALTRIEDAPSHIAAKAMPADAPDKPAEPRASRARARDTES